MLFIADLFCIKARLNLAVRNKSAGFIEFSGLLLSVRMQSRFFDKTFKYNFSIILSQSVAKIKKMCYNRDMQVSATLQNKKPR